MDLTNKKTSAINRGLLWTLLIKRPPLLTGVFYNPGTGLSSRELSLQVLSLLTVFTFVFEMGTGVFQSHGHQEPFRDSWIGLGFLVQGDSCTLKTAH